MTTRSGSNDVPLAPTGTSGPLDLQRFAPRWFESQSFARRRAGSAQRSIVAAFNAALLTAIVYIAVNACAQPAPKLHRAVMDQDAPAVTRALDTGADPNRRWRFTQSGHSGATFHVSPLELAVVRPDQGIIRMLVEHGADLYAANDLGMTAFEWAIRFDSPANARLLWEISDHATYRRNAGNALRLAFSQEDHEMFQWLLDEMANDESVDDLFAQFATFGSEGRDDGVKYLRQLLDAGLKPGYRALQAAVMNRNLETTKLLLDSGLSVDGGNDEYPPLHKALFEYETSVAQYLLERGADPDKLDAYGRTAAMNVVRVRYGRANETTVALRASFEKQTMTKLRLLEAHGADFRTVDPQGRTIVDYVDPAIDPDYARSRQVLRQLAQRSPAPAQPPPND